MADEGSQPMFGRRARRTEAPPTEDGSTGGEPAAPAAPPVKTGGWGEPAGETDPFAAATSGAPGGTAARPSRRQAAAAAAGDGETSGGGSNWMSESKTSGPREGFSSSAPAPPADDEDGIASRRRRKHFDDDDVIPVVPDLEEEAPDEDITRQVAEAPRNANRKVQTLTELDQDLKFQVRSTPSGADLGVLTACLCPADAVQEADEPWEFDVLLQEVSQNMQADIDKREAEDQAMEAFAEGIDQLGDRATMPVVTALTMIARDWQTDVAKAGSIVGVIVTKANTVPPAHRLPILYVADSIIKKVAGEYLRLFEVVIVDMVASAFAVMSPRDRSRVWNMLSTWQHTHLFPSALPALSARLRSMDGSSAPPAAQAPPPRPAHAPPRPAHVPYDTRMAPPPQGHPPPPHPGYGGAPPSWPQQPPPAPEHARPPPRPYAPPPRAAAPQPQRPVAPSVKRQAPPPTAFPDYPPPSKRGRHVPPPSAPLAPPPASAPPQAARQAPPPPTHVYPSNLGPPPTDAAVSQAWPAARTPQRSRASTGPVLPAVVAALYGSPNRCMQCSLRFSSKAQLDDHLDFHYKENRTRQTQSVLARAWYLSGPDWGRCEPRQNEPKQASFFELAEAKKAAEEDADGDGPQGDDEEDDSKYFVSVDSVTGPALCAVCGDDFTKTFSDEVNDWVYVGAKRRDDGKLVHPSCV